MRMVHANGDMSHGAMGMLWKPPKAELNARESNDPRATSTTEGVRVRTWSLQPWEPALERNR